jgi:hypothetical protein
VPVLASVAALPVTREVTATVTDPATGETTTVTGSYLVRPAA